MVVFQLYANELAASCGDAPNGPCTTKLHGLLPSTEYTVALAAFSEGGPSRTGEALTVPTPADVPSPVSSVAVSVGGAGASQVSDTLTASWDPADGGGDALGGYQVWACDAQSGACYSEHTSTATATVGPLPEGRNYTVTISAFNSVGSGPNVTATGAFTTYDVPMKPGVPYLGHDLAGLPNTTTIHARWGVPYDLGLEILRYNIMRDGEFIEQEASGFPQHIFVGLIPGTQHNLSVQAVNLKGASEFSETALFTTASDVPGAPTGIEARVSGSTIKVTLQPAAYTGGMAVTEYQVWSRSSGQTSLQWTQVAQAPNLDQLFDVPRSRLDLDYYFRGRAVNALGGGAWSEVALVQSESAELPQAPINV